MPKLATQTTKKGSSKLTGYLMGIITLGLIGYILFVPKSSTTPRVTPAPTDTGATIEARAIKATSQAFPTNTTAPTFEATVTNEETFYYTIAQANVRRCPQTTCDIDTQLNGGIEVLVITQVDGDTVSGSNKWYQTTLGYIHSSLISDSPPIAVATQPTNFSTNNSQQSAPPPTTAPISPVIGASCNGATACTQMTSCEQAYACLQAGDSGLDRDGDGVPCESICPGG